MDFDEHGFKGMGDAMVIKGNLTIDKSINISLSITPSEEMLQMMEERMGQMSGNMGSDMPGDRNGDNHMSDEDMGSDMPGGRQGEMPGSGQGEMQQGDMNRMDMDEVRNMGMTFSILITKLVEFEDADNNGFSENDTIVSTFGLNSSTLGDITTRNNSGLIEYFVASKDNSTFKLYAYINGSAAMPSEWKWSYEINYPFVSNTSKLAVIHEVYNSKGQMMADEEQMEHREGYGMVTNETMMVNGTGIPMRVKWDKTATIDGKESDVVITADRQTIALGFEQGKNIFYDPRLGIDPEFANQLDSRIYEYVANSLSDMPETTGEKASFLVAGLLVSLAATAVVIGRKRT